MNYEQASQMLIGATNEEQASSSMPDGAYAVIMEHKLEGPMILEADARTMTYDGALARAEALRAAPYVLRTCTAQLHYETGNELLFDQIGGKRRTGAESLVYGVVIERANEGPLLWEGTFQNTSEGAASDLMRDMIGRGDCIRACMVRLCFTGGNYQLFHDLERMTK